MGAKKSVPCAAETPLSCYLGPGQVVQATSEKLLVLVEGESVVRVQLALTFPYKPVVGDELLIIGSSDAFYVIGVLDGKGAVDLANTESLAVEAEGGWLRLSADKAICVEAETVHLNTQNLACIADKRVERFSEQRRVVRNSQSVEAMVVDERSEQGWLLRAARVAIKTVQKVRLKSGIVRLG